MQIHLYLFHINWWGDPQNPGAERNPSLIARISLQIETLKSPSLSPLHLGENLIFPNISLKTLGN